MRSNRHSSSSPIHPTPNHNHIEMSTSELPLLSTTRGRPDSASNHGPRPRLASGKDSIPGLTSSFYGMSPHAAAAMMTGLTTIQDRAGSPGAHRETHTSRYRPLTTVPLALRVRIFVVGVGLPAHSSSVSDIITRDLDYVSRRSFGSSDETDTNRSFTESEKSRGLFSKVFWVFGWGK